MIKISWNELDESQVQSAAYGNTLMSASFASLSSLDLQTDSLPVTHVGVRFEYEDRDAVYAESVARTDAAESIITLTVAPGQAKLFLAAVHYDENSPAHEYGPHRTLWFGRLDNIHIPAGAVVELTLNQVRSNGLLVRPEWRPEPGAIADAFQEGKFHPAENPGTVRTDDMGDHWYYFPIEFRDIFDHPNRSYEQRIVRIVGRSSRHQTGSEPGWTRQEIGCGRFPSNHCNAHQAMASVPILYADKFRLPDNVYFAIPPLMPDEIGVDWSDWSK